MDGDLLDGSRPETHNLTAEKFDVAAIIAAESVESWFQPIYSIKERKVIGFEALARATNPSDGTTVEPIPLFYSASRKGLNLSLDRLCRRRAIEGFAKLAALDPNLIVFMNLDVSILTDQIVGSNSIINLVREYGIAPERVAIEIVESHVRDQIAVHRFAAVHRRSGFLIALDDMGAGYSNLERIPALKPDIIKIDRTLLVDIEKDYHKQVLFDFFIQLSHKIGAMVIAEAVETREEALTCLERGADLVQGFYFSRPERPELSNMYNGLSLAVETGILLKKQRIARYAEHQRVRKCYTGIADAVCEALRPATPEGLDNVLGRTVGRFPQVECAYVLHESGMQISATVFQHPEECRCRTALFSPASAGTDQSAKDYYIFIGESQKQFVSEPYISLASGNICITVSTLLKHDGGRNSIVCVDIDCKVPVDETVPGVDR
jgi:EAL domain-containing protein (putative c-di-GMP-specific phosphodiesterase class I)